MSQPEPSAKPLVLEPGCAQRAELQGIQAEAASGVEEGLRFWCTLSGCQETAAMGRIWPGCHLPTQRRATPSILQPRDCSAPGQHRGESRTPAWAVGPGRSKTTTNKPARPVTEKEAGGDQGSLPGCTEDRRGFRERGLWHQSHLPRWPRLPFPRRHIAVTGASGTTAPQHPCLKLHLLLAAELRDFNLLITL